METFTFIHLLEDGTQGTVSFFIHTDDRWAYRVQAGKLDKTHYDHGSLLETMREFKKHYQGAA